MVVLCGLGVGDGRRGWCLRVESLDRRSPLYTYFEFLLRVDSREYITIVQCGQSGTKEGSDWSVLLDMIREFLWVCGLCCSRFGELEAV